MAQAQVITFDFYGTLVQWHEVLEIAFREMLARRGLPASGTAIYPKCVVTHLRVLLSHTRLQRTAAKPTRWSWCFESRQR